MKEPQWLATIQNSCSLHGSHQKGRERGKNKSAKQGRIGPPCRLKQLAIELCYWAVHWATSSYCIAPENINTLPWRNFLNLDPISSHPFEISKISTFCGKATWQSKYVKFWGWSYDIFKGHPFSYCPSIIDHFTVIWSVIWPLNGSTAEADLVLIKMPLFLLC